MPSKNKKEKISTSQLISMYYGFEKLKQPEINDEDRRKSKLFPKIDEIESDSKYLFEPEELSALLRFFKESGRLGDPQATQFYYEDKTHSSLFILNGGKSVSDVILIRVAEAILEECGQKDLCIEINSIGGKQALSQFVKDSTSYFRKNISHLTSSCRQAFKKSPIAPLLCTHKECLSLREEAPKPMDYLTDEDRSHYKEVLEYLEALKINYEVKPFVFGDPRYSTNTVFRIVNKKGSVLAEGTRFNTMAKKLELRRDIPAAGVKVFVGKQIPGSTSQAAKFEDPKFHFVQIGFDAKIQSLILIDSLRKAKIPVFQALNRDRLSTQLQAIKTNKAPYVLIMGQKEAIDGTVMVREANTRAQKTVLIKDLPDCLKEIIESEKKPSKKVGGKK